MIAIVARERSILHVENDPDDAMLIGRALRQVGITAPVQVVENGEEAIRYLQTHTSNPNGEAPPPPRLILLDLSMPLMDGHEFLHWIRSQPELRWIPVVVLTSSNAERDIVGAYDAGANGYLVKPLHHDEMIAMLATLEPFWLRWNRTVALCSDR